jgi:hypothetical protein
MEHTRFFTDQKALIQFLRKLRNAGVVEMHMSAEEMTFKMSERGTPSSAREPRRIEIPGVKVVTHGNPVSLDQLPAGERVSFETPKRDDDEDLFWSVPK